MFTSGFRWRHHTFFVCTHFFLLFTDGGGGGGGKREKKRSLLFQQDSGRVCCKLRQKFDNKLTLISHKNDKTAKKSHTFPEKRLFFSKKKKFGESGTKVSPGYYMEKAAAYSAGGKKEEEDGEKEK